MYYYFVVDRKLPYDINMEAFDSNSEELVICLQEYKKKYNTFDFSILSSGTQDSYGIKNIDYHVKPPNTEFMLPDNLRHKILLKIKENIIFIDQSDAIESKIINDFGIDNKGSLENISYYPFINKYKTFVELENLLKSANLVE